MGKKGIGGCRKKKHEGIQFQWPQELFFKEVLEQVKGSSDTTCDACMMRRAYNARKSGDWEGSKEELRKKGK